MIDMTSILKKILAFFGFGDKPDSAQEQFEEMFRRLTSQKTLDECSRMAYRAIQKGDTVQPNRVHPYEGVLKAECIKVDAALSAYRSEELTRRFGDAQYLLAQINGGMATQLSESSAAALERQISSVIAQNSPAVNALKTKLNNKEKELHIFKGAHGLQREAEKPAKQNTLYYAAAFAIVEAIANLFFLRESFTPIKAFFIAIALAALNVVGNVWFGNRYREKNHTDQARVAHGKKFFAYSVLLTLSVGALIAYARFYSQSIVNGEFIIESLVLLAIGVALGILAFTKGYSMDDPFPGYGPLSRDVEELNEELRAITENHATFCENAKSKADSAHTSARSRIQTAFESLVDTLPDLTRTLKEWEHQRDQIQVAFSQQQQVFKAIMTTHAKEGAPYPEAIDRIPDSPQLNALNNSLTHLTDRSDLTNQEINDLIRNIDASQAQLHAWWSSDAARNLLRWPV